MGEKAEICYSVWKCHEVVQKVFLFRELKAVQAKRKGEREKRELLSMTGLIDRIRMRECVLLVPVACFVTPFLSVSHFKVAFFFFLKVGVRDCGGSREGRREGVTGKKAGGLAWLWGRSNEVWLNCISEKLKMSLVISMPGSRDWAQVSAKGSKWTQGRQLAFLVAVLISVRSNNCENVNRRNLKKRQRNRRN